MQSFIHRCQPESNSNPRHCLQTKPFAVCRCLQSVIEGCGHLFNDHVTQDLLDLIFQALTHTNRFVRETGYQVCASLVRLGRDQGEKQHPETQIRQCVRLDSSCNYALPGHTAYNCSVSCPFLCPMATIIYHY